MFTLMLRGLAALCLFALPCAEAATINLIGSGDANNAGGTIAFSIRNNDEIGSQALALGSSVLRFEYEWYQDWLWLDFVTPTGAFVETYTEHRTTPFLTSPSSGYGWGTITLSTGPFTSTFSFRFDDFLMTGSGTWQIGNGAPSVLATVPDALPLWSSALVFGLLIGLHRRFLSSAY
jgi:hypothetical protein